jgi:outer membrane immunogenic protein
MKLTTIGGLTVSALLIAAPFGAASAADMPLKAPIVAPAAYSWTGCYIGAKVGAGAYNTDYQFFTSAPSGERGVGGVYGGEAGCNYQTGQLVVGIEGEGFGSSMKATSNRNFSPAGILDNVTATARNTWDYNIAARFGLAVDRALIYGKAGLVVGDFKYNASGISTGGIETETGSNHMTGLLIGVGLEYGITANWSAKFEYDYLGFQDKSTLMTQCFPGTTTPCFPEAFRNIGADKQIVEFGLNYRFGGGYAPISTGY